ncbi:hypothetical protein ACFVH6_08180 [Spirillospora sp. NPDC127200]
MTGGRKSRALFAAFTVGVLACACGSAGEDASAPVERPHGYVEGAEEAAEAQRRLVLVDDAGAVRMLDPATEKVTEATRIAGVRQVESDGRFVYLATAGGVGVFDSGVWTVDHGDHVHYYRAASRAVGEFRTGAAPIAAAGDPAITALGDGDEVHVLDRRALEGGKVGATRRLQGRAALPYAERLLVAAADGTVTVHGRDGRANGRIGETCPDPRGQAITRRGAVFGCADGALVVTGQGAALSGEKIPYPGRGAGDERAVEFRHRPGTGVLAAKAGRDGVWILDLSGGRWTRIRSGPVAAIIATGEDSPVLVLGEKGELRSYDPRTGKADASTRLIRDSGGKRHAPVVQADSSRAYVTDPVARAVHEIDYRDGLRVARTFKLPFTPAHMAETGR